MHLKQTRAKLNGPGMIQFSWISDHSFSATRRNFRSQNHAINNKRKRTGGGIKIAKNTEK